MNNNELILKLAEKYGNVVDGSIVRDIIVDVLKCIEDSK